MSTKPTSPRWIPDADGQAYTLTDGDVRCRVWHAQGGWSAVITYGLMSEAAYDFSTFEEACAWSEQQAALRK